MGLNCRNWNGDGTHFLEPLYPSNTSGRWLDTDFLFAMLHGTPYETNEANVLWDESIVPFLKNDPFNAARLKSVGNSYHFDAFKVGAYFKEVAVENGVKYVPQEVSGINVDDETGFITSVTLGDGSVITSDLWFDCTGFKKKLISAVGGEWHSYSDYLPCNKAMPYIYKYQDNETVRPETLSWAMPNGWMWQIPTQERYGCGYVYSDKFVSDEEALREMEEVTGRKITPLRVIKFNPGRQKRVWIKNVIALGLASNFLEPLEATSIHSTIIQIRALMNIYMGEYVHETATEAHSNHYNTYFNSLIDQYADLIQLHYITKREDSAFWKYVKHELPKRDSVSYLIDICKYRCPSPYDTRFLNGGAGWGVYSAILPGLGILTNEVAVKTMRSNGDCISSDDIDTGNNYKKAVLFYKNNRAKYMTHNELIERINNINKPVS